MTQSMDTAGNVTEYYLLQILRYFIFIELCVAGLMLFRIKGLLLVIYPTVVRSNWYMKNERERG